MPDNVHVCVPGLYDRLTGACSDMNYRHDCRHQQPTSGCQVALETLVDRQQKAEKQEGGLIFHLPLIVLKKSHKLLANRPRLEKSTFPPCLPFLDSLVCISLLVYTTHARS